MRDFGKKRVIQPKDFFPVSAWSLDNNEKIKSDEMRVKVERIKLEEGNFRQLCNSCDYDFEKIKERIINITERRGKLHNQLTDSGGICSGIVDEVGHDYDNKIEMKKGMKVIGIASLTSVPLKIKEVKSINYNYGQIEVEAYAIFFSASPVIPMPKGIAEEILLSAFDESGSIAKAGEIAKHGDNFLILGSNIFTVLIYAASMKTSHKGKCRITACLALEDKSILTKKDIENLLYPYADKLYITNSLSPMENYLYIREKEFGTDTEDENLFDSSIICSNMMGMEAIGVLLTKNHGNLFFTNLIDNYNLVVLLAESFGKNINTISLEEYTSEFPVFTVELIFSISSNLEKIHEIYKKNNIVNRFPRNEIGNYNLENISTIEGYAYNSPKTEAMLEDALNIASYDCNVMILGETGVGKERILDIIHKNSSRKGNHCVKINCSAIAENLAESEFFGYDKGAFTGAKEIGKKGFFELANNGILFLDEVGDLPLSLQAKLLRVLQESQFYRVGGEAPININVRVICATNRSLRDMVAEGKFREDLYYRLNICELEILPLRERKEDVQPLVDMFAQRYNDKYMLDKRFTIEAYDRLKAYRWPGNVRELENTIHKLVINTKSDIIDDVAVERTLWSDSKSKDKAEEISGDIKVESVNDSSPLDSIMGQHEKAIIADALRKGRTTRNAAAILGISQSQLMRKKKRYNL